MRRILTAAALLGVFGTASASDRLYDEANYYGASDFAAMAFYRVNFGAERATAPRQTFGFKAFNERARTLGLPEMFKVEFGAESTSVHMNGVDLVQTWLIARQAEGGVGGGATTGGGTTAQIVTTGIVIGTVVVSAIGVAAAVTDDDDTAAPAPAATGSGGG